MNSTNNHFFNNGHAERLAVDHKLLPPGRCADGGTANSALGFRLGCVVASVANGGGAASGTAPAPAPAPAFAAACLLPADDFGTHDGTFADSGDDAHCSAFECT